MIYASKEEEYFEWWLADLAPFEIFYLKKYQPKPFVLFDGFSLTYNLQMKTKVKQKNETLLTAHQYQADFIIYWNEKYKNKIFFDFNDRDIVTDTLGIKKNFPFLANYSERHGKYYSVIDIKGNYNQNDAWRRFAIDQKWVFKEYGIYVQKVIPVPQMSGKRMIPANALFPNTFVPVRYKLTDVSMKPRKINFTHRSAIQYIKDIMSE